MDEFVPLVQDLRTGKKGNTMKKSYVKSLKEYEEPFEFEADKILAALRRHKDSKKTIQELKRIAEKQEIPYQVLIRVLILDGLNRIKKAA
jgi:hypothetical protein